MYLGNGLEYEEAYKSDQKIGVCEECGDTGVIRVVGGRDLCEACADLIEDLPEEA